MKVLVWRPGGDVAERVTEEELPSLRGDRSVVLWVDCNAPTEADYEFLRAQFDLDARALAECRHAHDHRARMADYGKHLFIVWPIAPDDPARLQIEAQAVFFFLGPNYLVSLHDESVAVLDEVSHRTVDDTEIAIEGSDWLLLRVLDDAVSTYFPAIDRLTDKLDELEDVMFGAPDQRHMAELFEIKRAMLTLRRMAAPERDVVNSLARHGSTLIDQNTFVYFQDVFDHLARITDSIDMARDVIGGAMDIYLSSISNRMNDVMKRLTVVATIFMPITAITSFYGMNVRPLTQDGPPYLWLILIGMLVITVVMIIDFRRRGWW